MGLIHNWGLGYKEAAILQKKLAKKIIKENRVGNIKRIAGIDVKYRRKEDRLYCAVLVLDYPSLELIESKTSIAQSTYPYVPGLLSFREGPVVIDCFSYIENMPDLLFFDGNGYMHPRRMGLASHLGLLVDKPSIGIAKSKLLGSYSPPPASKGNYNYVTDNGEVIGAAVVTRDRTKPVFVSIGHKVSLSFAIDITLKFSKYRVPEPTRLAHNFLKKEFG
ncbi:MAG: deoxyribonuclease V [Actinomycetota bacterium]